MVRCGKSISATLTDHFKTARAPVTSSKTWHDIRSTEASRFVLFHKDLGDLYSVKRLASVKNEPGHSDKQPLSRDGSPLQTMSV